jgi:hypothetical protein
MGIPKELDVLRALGIWNNLAHVNSLLGDDNQTNACWNQLLTLMVYITTDSYSEYKDSDSEEAAKHFIGNVSHLILKNSTTPPAA